MSAQLPPAVSEQAENATANAFGDVLRVVLAYAAFACIWIVLSDLLIGWLFSDPARMFLASTIKGWLFVVFTSLLLYVLIRRLRRQVLAVAEQKLAALADKAQAQSLLVAIADNSSDAIFAKDLHGRYLMLNRRVERIAGKSAEQMLGQDDRLLFPLQVETIRANDLQVMQENRIVTYEECLASADGERIYLATKGPLHDAQGKVSGMFGISRDITERQRAAEDLRQQAELLNLRNAELERFNHAAVDRELAMIELKRQVNVLSAELGRDEPYSLGFADELAEKRSP